MKKRKRVLFTFHFMLCLMLMFTLNLVDIFMLRQRAITSMEEAETVEIPKADVKVHPYHFWVNTVFYITAQLTVALSYWFITKDTRGALILLIIAVVFTAFAVQDVWFFFYQGRELPEKWTWLYWQNKTFGNPLPSRFVLNLATLGSILIVTLFLLHHKKLR